MVSPVKRRTIVVLVFTLLAIVGALIIELALSLQSERAFGHTQAGHITGWVGVFLMSLVFVYSYKKRKGPKPGWPKGWFRVHMVTGVVGPLLILVHSGAHFHALVPVLAMLAMGLVVISGIAGQAIHYLALRRLNDQRRNLMHQGLSQEDIDTRLYDMVAREETFRVWQYIHGPLTLTFLALTVLHVWGALYFGGW